MLCFFIKVIDCVLKNKINNANKIKAISSLIVYLRNADPHKTITHAKKIFKLSSDFKKNVKDKIIRKIENVTSCRIPT